MSIPREGSRDISNGIIVSVTPDVCKTPVGSSLVPVPYSITAVQADDANTAATVRMTRRRSHNMASLVTKCVGDAPGTGTGIVSGTVGSVCRPKTHSGTVNIEGRPAIRHSDEWYMNNRNTVGKLTYIETRETFDVTPAIILSQNSSLEAPSAEEMSPFVAAILGGMERAREERLPEGSYQLAQALEVLGGRPALPRPSVPQLPMSNPPTVFRGPTARPANANNPPPTTTQQPNNSISTPQQPNRIAREPSPQLPTPIGGAPAPMPGGAAGAAINNIWAHAQDIVVNGHPLNVSPDVYAQAANAEAALRQWATDYSAANGGAPVPDHVWGANQETLSNVTNNGMNQLLDARRSSAEGRAILREYADTHGIATQDLTEQDMRQILSSDDPMNAQIRSLAATENQVVATRTDENVSVREDEENRRGKECLVGKYEDIVKKCDGEAHHIVPDMVYRLGKRPKGRATSSTDNRIPNSPTLDQGMSICLTPTQHGSGPTGIHGRLRDKLNALGAVSQVAGTAPMGQILAASLTEIVAIPDLTEECKLLAVAAATEQVRSTTGFSAPGRTREAPLPSADAVRVMRAATYN